MAKSKTPITVTQSMFANGDKVCRKCGAQLKHDFKRCTTCGSDKFFNDYHEYELTKMKYCSKCGRVNDGGYTRCPECGSSHFVSYEQSTTTKKITSGLKSTVKKSA